MTLPLRSWDPTVHAALVDLIARTPAADAPVAVFDWDDTVIAGDVSLSLLQAMDDRHGTDWHDTYFRLLAAHGRAVAYPQITRWFAGQTPASFDALADEIIDAALASGRVAWRPELVDLIAALHGAGWQVWVVSASPKVAVSAMARRVGIPPERVLAMRLVLGADGRFTEEIDPPTTFCEGKLVAVKQFIGRPPVLCAGDSRSDVDMMGWSQHGLLIDGHDADLRAEAIARGWLRQPGWRHTPAEPGVRTETK